MLFTIGGKDFKVKDIIHPTTEESPWMNWKTIVEL
jgi:hypothetical protein